MKVENMTVTTVMVMVMSVMICVVAAVRPPERLLIFRVQNREGLGLTGAQRNTEKREATSRLEYEAPARQSPLVLLLTSTSLEHTRRRRATQGDPGGTMNSVKALAKDTPEPAYQVASEAGSDGTQMKPEQGTKQKRRRKIRKIRKKIPGVSARSGVMVREGNGIKVRRVKKRKRVPAGGLQGTQLRMGTATKNGILLSQGTAAKKDKAPLQEAVFRQGTARQNAQGEDEYYYYYDYYYDTNDTASPSEGGTSGNASGGTAGQQGGGTEGEEDYYYYDSTDGQEGDGTEGDQNYYYDETDGTDGGGGDSTDGQEGDGTEGDQNYYYDETEGTDGDGGDATDGQEGDGTEGDQNIYYDETGEPDGNTGGETEGTDEEFVTFLSTTTTPASTTTTSSSTSSTSTTLSSVTTGSSTSSTSSTGTSTSTTTTTTNTIPSTTSTTTPSTTPSTTSTTTSTTTPTTTNSTQFLTTFNQASYIREDGAWVWGPPNRVAVFPSTTAVFPPTIATAAPVSEPVTINTGFGIVVLANSQDVGNIGVQSNGFGIIIPGTNGATPGASNTGFGSSFRSKTGSLDSSKLRFGAAAKENPATSTGMTETGDLRSGTASKISFPLRSGSAIHSQSYRSPTGGKGKRKLRRRKGKRKKKPSSASAAPPPKR